MAKKSTVINSRSFNRDTNEFRRYDLKLLLYGANKLDSFLSKYQVDKTSKKQKYIGNLENYLTELGNVHQDQFGKSCFKLSLASLEDLNKDFSTLRSHIEKLSTKMRRLSKELIKLESMDYNQINKASKKLKPTKKSTAAALAALISHLNAKEKKKLAALIKKLEKLTNAKVSTGVVSRIKNTKTGKAFYKKYVTKAKETKKATSKISTYYPKKYKSRSEWRKALVEKYKGKNLSEADAKTMASKEMKLKEKLANNKITKEQFNDSLNKKLSEVKMKIDDKNVKTETINQIKNRNEGKDAIEVPDVDPGQDPTPDVPVTYPAPNPDPTPTPAPPSGGTGEGVGGGAVGGAVGGGVVHESLPDNQQPQSVSDFHENVSNGDSKGIDFENQVDESAEGTQSSDEGIDFSDNLDGDSSQTDSTTGDEGDSSSDVLGDVGTSSPSSKKSSSGGSGVIPVIAGVAAAGAAGIGTKIVLDKRANSSNEGNFTSENWNDTAGDDYGLSSSDTEYYEKTAATKDDNLIESNNTDNNYDYKASSIDEINVDEKAKKDEEEKISSFNDSIAYDAISDADISATH